MGLSPSPLTDTIITKKYDLVTVHNTLIYIKHIKVQYKVENSSKLLEKWQNIAPYYIYRSNPSFDQNSSKG